MRIRRACERVGREASEVRLVAVSKTQGIERVLETFAYKQILFGENYVQEALEKIAGLPGAEWHFIGALQSNKARQVVGRFALIHSVDRASLADALSKRAVEAGVVQNVLIELNFGEASKSGVSDAELGTLISHARSLPGLRVRGLMGLPPFTESAEGSRIYFRKLRELRTQFADEDFRELSMGTTQDFEVAVEEGATLVRVGTEIFGSRASRG